MLIKGEKPVVFPSNKAIAKRDWEDSQRPHKEYPRPLRVGSKFVQYLKDHPDSTYDEIAGMYGHSKVRVSQMIALCERLPAEITDLLMDIDEPEILKYWTERRLKPLTRLASDEDKIKKFDEMREVLNSFR